MQTTLVLKFVLVKPGSSLLKHHLKAYRSYRRQKHVDTYNNLAVEWLSSVESIQASLEREAYNEEGTTI